MATCETLCPSTTSLNIPYSHTDLWQAGISTQTHLVSLTKTFVNLFNARIYDHPILYSHISPDICINMCGEVGYGVETLKQNYRRTADASPAFHAENFNESVMIDEFRGTAAVLLSQDLTSHSCEGRRMCAALVFNWERSVEGWVCKDASMIFGTPEFLP